LLSDEILEKYRAAGCIASEVRTHVPSIVTSGRPIIEICDSIENLIRSRGATPAFPCNVSVNEVAAHYSSPPGDQSTIPPDSLVKVDIGVSVEGYIADTATTVCLNPEYEGMVLAVEKALSQAIKTIRPNIKTTQVGEVIQKTITQYGFKPIWNLSGHQMRRYVVHTGKSIPNVARFTVSKIQEDEVYAVEPFLTFSHGSGEVRGTREAYIFRLQRAKRTRKSDVKHLQEFIQQEFQSLPFSQRWFSELGRKDDWLPAFNELLRNRSITGYPPLVERKNLIVAQAEHTVIVTNKGCLVTTL
jgi:methionyl aminopeptidase